MNSSEVQTIKCSFCGEDNVQIPGDHPCIAEVFKLMNSAAKLKEEKTLFDDIDNLVFQGGGVKGVSYLGVIQKNEDENFKHRGFMDKATRVAGTSAGSLMALYMALRLKSADVGEYLKKDYETLLDTTTTLNVTVPSRWLIFPTTEVKTFTMKKIILSIVDKIQKIKNAMKGVSEDSEEAQEIMSEMTELITNTLTYIGKHYGILAGLVASWKSGQYAGAIAKWLLEHLTPDGRETEDQSDWDQSLFPDQKLKAQRPDQEGDVSSSNRAHSQKMIKCFHHCMNEAIKRAKDTEQLQPSGFNGDPEDEVGLKSSEDLTSEGYLRSNLTASSQNIRAVRAVHDTDQYLDGVELANSIAELVVYLVSSKENDVGLFTGNIVKEQLILDPIRKKLGKDANPTFEELAKATDPDTGLKFRELFVTSYNVQLKKTEVFSALHTPKVLVADAIRASISIPVFFEPVEINEVVSSTQKESRKVYPDNQPAGEPARYMDGGVLDNYPIWIFDDLKYCLEDKIKDFNPVLRCTVQNPRTLGFRILGVERIKLYINPYVDMDKKTQPKETGNQAYANSFKYLLPHVTEGITGHEENTYLKEGNWPRSIYINNLNVSSVAFNMSNDQKKLLIKEGQKALDIYIKRANRKQFRDEGQKYPIGRIGN